jgi:indolepyruvate ferredoxin oxidoreductase alpha subunit
MERSFKKEVQALKLGEGETFRGEGILAPRPCCSRE